VYENDTDATDADGIPEHSISAVVQGGDVTEIATAIAVKKTPGTGTYGTTTEIVVDSNGVPNTINFFEPTEVPIDVEVTISAKAGYVSTTGDLIQTNLEEYLNALEIGGMDGYVYNSKLCYPADNTGTLTSTYTITSITTRRDADAFATTDIPLLFNELPIAGTVNVTVA